MVLHSSAIANELCHLPDLFERDVILKPGVSNYAVANSYNTIASFTRTLCSANYNEAKCEKWSKEPEIVYLVDEPMTEYTNALVL